MPDKPEPPLNPLPPVEAVDAFECACGHHANDHDFGQSGRDYCGGGLCESCACREFRPRPTETPL